ncbi:DUF6232 family protein [Dactylosporangium sp. NBC_01737]|nr:DUF6232 family protein [Dactylosporangium sp. NBC_01737]
MLGGGQRDVTVRVNRRTISIAGQTYQLSNIARVQNIELKPDRPKIALRLVKRTLPVIAAVVLINVVLGNTGGSGEFLGWLDLIAVVGLAGYAVFSFVSVSRRSRFVMLLETTGAPFSVVASKQSAVIDKLVGLVADAMENPPTVPQVVHFGDVVMGDKLKQIGDRNIGKLVDG